MHEFTRGAVVQALEAQEAAISTPEGWQRHHAQGIRDAIGRAMRRNDESDVPGVSEAAKAWRASVFEPLKRRAVETGLLPADVGVDTAASYFSRMWNRPAIQSHEAEFRQVVRGWLGSLAAAEKSDAERVGRARQSATGKDDLDLGIMRREDR